MTTQNPQWLQERIWDNQRQAKARVCDCGDLILTGLNDDVCAFSVSAEPYRLNTHGQAAAAAAGRPLLTYIGGRLYRRDSATPSDDARVLAAHRCADPTPTTWRLPVPALRQEADDAPRF